MSKQNKSIRYMAQLALLIAVQIVMKIVGLGMVPIGALKLSFLTVPVAIGAIVMGPLAGTILGSVFGLISFYDALTAPSAMMAAFMAVSPALTFVLAVCMRTLMGLCTGWIYKLVGKAITNVSKYFIGAICAPLLNTIFFMGFIVLVFYQTEFVQNLVTALNASNPIMFIIILVGFQGLVEACACCLVGGIVSKAVDTVVNKG